MMIKKNNSPKGAPDFKYRINSHKELNVGINSEDHNRVNPKKIIYWIFTAWLALGMLSAGIVQVANSQDEVTRIIHLGYPVYLLTMLGIWKILGVIAILAPKFALLKEWAYAGFFFTMSGAVFSHVILGDPLNETFPSILLLTLTMISWYFRPAERKVIGVLNK